jgi:hypothetical protein
MDGKRVFKNIFFLLLFLTLAEACVLVLALYHPDWDSRGVIGGFAALIGLASGGCAVLVFRELKTALVPKPQKPKRIMEEHGRLLQYKGKEK